MKRSGWIAIGLGVGGLILFARRRGRDNAPTALGSPVEVDGIPRVTPNGHYGAPRKGPPVHTHQGVDLQARPGSRVLAIGDGRIVDTAPGLGLVVRKLELATPASWTDGARKVRWVVYADLGQPLVNPGDRVKRGDPIALVDKRGFVHFAVKDLVGNREVFFDSADAGFRYALSKPTGPTVS
jgi:murein DD-endopeptidase MepM/ murein hydrolase activator NlpD